MKGQKLNEKKSWKENMSGKEVNCKITDIYYCVSKKKGLIMLHSKKSIQKRLS